MHPSADPIPSIFGFRTVAPSAAAQDVQEPQFPEAVRGQMSGTIAARFGPPPTSPATCAMSIM